MPKREVGPFIELPDGTRRHLGLIPLKYSRKVSALPMMAESELIPQSDWVEFNDWPYDIIKIKNQNSKGACNGHAAATSIESNRYVAGMEHVPLSAWYVYSILCQGRDFGSLISDALMLTTTDGIAPESLVNYGIIDPSRLTSEAHAAAPRYRGEIGAMVRTPQEIGTVIQRRQSLNLAVCYTPAFDRLDAEGVPGMSKAACNHAVHCSLGMKKAKKGKWAGKWLILCTNSWGEEWGDKGQCWFPVDFLPTASYFEAYTISAVMDAPDDPTRPPEGS
jgi:C1A family cysteine protease